MAQRDTDPRKRLAHWKAAAERNPRNPSYWQALAGVLPGRSQLCGSGQGVERRRTGRHRPRRARAHAPGAHDHRAAAAGLRGGRKEARSGGEGPRDRKAEDRGARRTARARSQGQQRRPAVRSESRAVVGRPQASGQTEGTLKQVDCLGKQARLVLEGDDRKTVKLLVADPGKIAISGGGEQSARLRRAEGAARRHRVLPQGQRQAGHRRRGCHHRVPVTQAGTQVDDAARYRWLVLAVFVLSTAINYLDRQTLAACAPLQAEFHLSNAQYGLIWTAFSDSRTPSARAVRRNADRPHRAEPRHQFGGGAVVMRRNRHRVHQRTGRAGGLPRGPRGGRSGRHSGGGKGDPPVPAPRRESARQRGQSGRRQPRLRGGAAAGHLAGARKGWRLGVHRHRACLAWRGFRCGSGCRAAPRPPRPPTRSRRWGRDAARPPPVGVRRGQRVEHGGLLALDDLDYALPHEGPPSDAGPSGVVRVDPAPVRAGRRDRGRLAFAAADRARRARPWRRVSRVPAGGRRFAGYRAVPLAPTAAWACAGISLSIFAVAAFSVNMYTLPLDTFGGAPAAFAVSFLVRPTVPSGRDLPLLGR